MNILILSCGSRNKIVQYFKKELTGKGRVFAADSSRLAPALYEADRYFIIPSMEDEGYLESVLQLCRENEVKAVLSLIDPELSILAKHRDRFMEEGTMPIVSDYRLVEMCLDKADTNRFLKENGFPAIRSYLDREAFEKDLQDGRIQYPVFAKPVDGSASTGICKIDSKADLDHYLACNDKPLIQEFMEGPEYGADVYIDFLTGKPVSIFIKEKLKMRSGETDKAVSVKDEKMSRMITDFVMKAGFRGIIDIDLFKSGDDYYISEVNPRFGGGYPHAYACGINVPAMIIRNLAGEPNEAFAKDYEPDVFMMKYSEVAVFKDGSETDQAKTHAKTYTGGMMP